MTSKTILLLCLLFAGTNLKAQPYKIVSNTERILFIGNSITYKGDYISYIEAYLTLKYPDLDIDFMNLGLSSETVSGLSEPNHANGAFPRPDLRERLDRVLKATQPDLIFACYGMNDGIYLPFDLERFKRYREGIEWLHQKATEQGIEIVFVTPPVYDEQQGAAYANVLDVYADWLISCRYTRDWKVIDIHEPMNNYVRERRKLDTSFHLAQDGIHPNLLGHWLIAKEILVGINEIHLKSVESPKNVFANFADGEQVLDLVMQKQAIMKHAWLSHTKHQRPGVPDGLPLEDALIKRDSLKRQIKRLVR